MNNFTWVNLSRHYWGVLCSPEQHHGDGAEGEAEEQPREFSIFHKNNFEFVMVRHIYDGLLREGWRKTVLRGWILSVHATLFSAHESHRRDVRLSLALIFTPNAPSLLLW